MPGLGNIKALSVFLQTYYDLFMVLSLNHREKHQELTKESNIKLLLHLTVQGLRPNRLKFQGV